MVGISSWATSSKSFSKAAMSSRASENSPSSMALLTSYASPSLVSPSHFAAPGRTAFVAVEPGDRDFEEADGFLEGDVLTLRDVLPGRGAWSAVLELAAAAGVSLNEVLRPRKVRTRPQAATLSWPSRELLTAVPSLPSMPAPSPEVASASAVVDVATVHSAAGAVAEAWQQYAMTSVSMTSAMAPPSSRVVPSAALEPTHMMAAVSPALPRAAVDKFAEGCWLAASVPAVGEAQSLRAMHGRAPTPAQAPAVATPHVPGKVQAPVPVQAQALVAAQVPVPAQASVTEQAFALAREHVPPLANTQAVAPSLAPEAAPAHTPAIPSVEIAQPDPSAASEGGLASAGSATEVATSNVSHSLCEASRTLGPAITSSEVLASAPTQAAVLPVPVAVSPQCKQNAVPIGFLTTAAAATSSHVAWHVAAAPASAPTSSSWLSIEAHTVAAPLREYDAAPTGFMTASAAAPLSHEPRRTAAAPALQPARASLLAASAPTVAAGVATDAMEGAVDGGGGACGVGAAAGVDAPAVEEDVPLFGKTARRAFKAPRLAASKATAVGALGCGAASATAVADEGLYLLGTSARRQFKRPRTASGGGGGVTGPGASGVAIAPAGALASDGVFASSGAAASAGALASVGASAALGSFSVAGAATFAFVGSSAAVNAASGEHRGPALPTPSRAGGSLLGPASAAGKCEERLEP